MNSSMSGWSTSRTTIFAARRVLPPDLIVLEDLGFFVGGEVAAGRAPAADRVDDASDHLLDARLALRRAHASAEVLLGDDVGRGLRPELRELDPLLFEGGLVLARNEGIAD